MAAGRLTANCLGSSSPTRKACPSNGIKVIMNTKEMRLRQFHLLPMVSDRLRVMGLTNAKKIGYGRAAHLVCGYYGVSPFKLKKRQVFELFHRLVGVGAVRLTPTLVKPELTASPGFYMTREWRELRYEALKINGGKCQLCGCGRAEGKKIHVDHIKPRSKYPELELDLTNLQVLCEDCNLGKSNRDETDWRQSA